MSLEKSIEKLTNAITAAKKTPSVMADPSMEPMEPIGLPEIRVVCKTETTGTWPDVVSTCVCRDKTGREHGTMDGPCPIEGFKTTLPMRPVHQ
jgi:hypothetical protein